MWNYKLFKHDLKFRTPIRTSRGSMDSKRSYYIKAWDNQGKTVWGECGILPGLSIDYSEDYENILSNAASYFVSHKGFPSELDSLPSIRCGLEQIYLGLQSDQPWRLFNNDFYNKNGSITINGLIWMGKEDFLRSQIEHKIAKGFHCIKMKIGALDWETEMKLLSLIRNIGGSNLIIRVDANGAWSTYDEAMKKLEDLAELSIHSIEQPIKPGLFDISQKTCANTPVPIVLDEELFPHITVNQKIELINYLKPQFIVLKPSLAGGFQGCNDWIEICDQANVGYWITSALEGNIGLNAISQYAYSKNIPLHQGLGTGSLYSNNIDSPLYIEGERILYDNEKTWTIDESILEPIH